MRKYFDQMRIAGVQYHEALFCREELKAGRKLRMVRDTENKYDADAVALYCGDIWWVIFHAQRTANWHCSWIRDGAICLRYSSSR